MNRKRIDTVLRVRELQERLARQEVVQARRTLTLRMDAERAAREQLDDRSRPLGTIETGRLLAHRLMLDSGVAHATRLAGHVAGAAGEVDQSMSSWRVVAERLDGIERLAERAADQEREDDMRAEAALIDDLVIARWTTDDPADGGGSR